jgi:HEAT repeat protein
MALFDDPATLPVLRKMAADPDPEVRSAIRVALRRIERRSSPAGAGK